MTYWKRATVPWWTPAGWMPLSGKVACGTASGNRSLAGARRPIGFPRGRKSSPCRRVGSSANSARGAFGFARRTTCTCEPTATAGRSSAASATGGSSRGQSCFCTRTAMAVVGGGTRCAATAVALVSIGRDSCWNIYGGDTGRQQGSRPVVPASGSAERAVSRFRFA